MGPHRRAYRPGAERIKGFFRALAPTLKQAGRDTQDVAQRVNAQVQAAQTTGRHAAAQAATPARSQANVHSQQDVKIDIHTADPILAGRRRRRHQQTPPDGTAQYRQCCGVLIHPADRYISPR
ncbi:hypothetical protein [Xylella fastidiosa]|uniref:hypothetical protein n=1 Tax=Xylella fastidiosa TaxID=2371 RepID=UPI0034DF6D05